jgi:hypothetical protein
MTVDEPTCNVEETTSREVWAVNRLYVSINRTSDGGLQFRGHDLNPNIFGDDEYEYVLTANGDRTADLVAALGGAADADPLDLIEANIEMIVHTGEMTWLKSIGIEPGFWSWP